MLKQKMKQTLTGAAVAGALSLSVGMGTASAITVGGITWDNVAPHFQVASIFENVITGNSQTLSGYGEVTQINGDTANGPGGFCVALCELTYEFGGFTSKDFTGTEVNFTGGWINFYVDTFPGGTTNFTGNGTNVANAAAATDGTLWLQLVGHSNTIGGVSAVVFGTGTSLGTGNDTGDGVGLFDVGNGNGNPVAGPGLADAAFDKNFNPDNIGGFADFTFGSSFGTIGLPATLAAQCVPDFDMDVPPNPVPGTGFLDPSIQCLTGSADLQQNAEVPMVSEPATLAILGMSLVGLGAIRRRKTIAK